MEYVAEKLGNHSFEVRGRALESLEFKWKYGLVNSTDLLQERKVLRCLLGLLSIGDGTQTTAVVLLLLRKMAAADVKIAKALLELGAMQQLHALTSHASDNRAKTAGSTGALAAVERAAPRVFITPGVWPDELLPSVEALVTILLEPAHNQQLHTKHNQQQLHSSTGPSRVSSQEGSAGPVDPSIAAREERAVHPVHSRLLGPVDVAERPEPAGLAAMGADPAGLLHRPGDAGKPDLYAAHGLRHSNDRPGASDSTASQQRGFGGAQPSHSAPARAAAADGSNVSAFDERLLRARARVDWREQDGGQAGASAWAPSSQRPGHITLPVVALSASDDQALFELNVRLQYSDDERLLLPALLELAGSVGLDLPAEALLQRQSILDNCLALLSSTRSSRQLQQAVATVLLQLIDGLKSSLVLAQHPELAPSEFGAQLARTAAGVPGANALDSLESGPAAADGGRNGSLLTAARLVPGFSAAASALAACTTPVLDPSSPNCYPHLPVPGDTGAGADGVWGLTGIAASLHEQQFVDVTAAVTSICLQVAGLLCNPDRHYELLPIFEAALPLLVAPIAALVSAGLEVVHSEQQQQDWLQAASVLTSASLQATATGLQQHQAQQLQSELQAVWRGILGALARALASTAAVAADDRAAVLAAALSGQPAAAVNGLVAGDAAAVLLGAGGCAGGAPAAAAVVINGGEMGLYCWDLRSLNLLLLALRLINAAPASWCTNSMIPGTLADAAAAAAADQALALLLPELRTSAAVLLQQLRPASLAALQAVQAVQTAVAAAEEVSGKLLNDLQQNPVLTADRWMLSVSAAAPSLGFNPRADAQVLHCVIHGLATIVGASHAANTVQQQQQVGQLLVQLLCHQQQQVQLQVLQLLATAAAEAQHAQPLQPGDGQQLTPGQQLIMLQAVTEQLVVQGLADQRTQVQVSGVLLSILQSLGQRAAKWLMPWRCWISCCAGDDGDAVLVERLQTYSHEMLQEFLHQGQGLEELPDSAAFWQSPVAAVLQDLFNSRMAVRRAAGRQLLMLLMNGSEEPLDEYEELADDPLKGLLDSAASQSAALPSSSNSYYHHLPTDPLTDASASLTANFTVQDVRNLLQVLQNQGLAQELRRSAAEELLALSPEPRLLRVMAEPQNLQAIWSLCVPSWPDDDINASCPAIHLHVGAGAPSGDIFDMQLAVAALQLLAGLLARSPGALKWIADDAPRLLVPLLPLVLHALHSVRRAVARVLALAVFGKAAQQWQGFPAAAAVAGCSQTLHGEQKHADANGGQHQLHQAILLPDGANAVLLPAPFLKQHKFPFRVQPVPVSEIHVSATGQGPDACATATQQRALVKQLVEQQQLLQLACNDAAAARAMLSDCLPPDAHHVTQRVLAATANQLFNVDVAAVAQRLLPAVAAARSHAECEQALRQLEQLCSSTRGLLALANAANSNSSVPGAAQEGDKGSYQLQAAGVGWEAAFERLLSAAPISADDQHLWLRLLMLLERMLAVARLTQVQYSYLQLLLQRSVTAWLRQPATAKDVPRPPLALKQQPSSAAAAAAVADMLGLNTNCAATVAAAGPDSSSNGLLQIQISRHALRVLLQLVKAVKQHCQVSSLPGQSSQTVCYSLSALQPAGLMQLLCSSLLGRSEGVDYCCRYLAAALLKEVIGALQDVAHLQQLYGRTSNAANGAHTVRQLLFRCPTATAATRGQGPDGPAASGLSKEASAVTDCLEALICKVMMPVAGRKMPGFQGKALVKAGLEVLLVLVQGPLVAQLEWSQTWAAIGGTFWLSRLCRDRETAIRWKAMTLVGQLLSPGAAATQTLIAHSWPDCGHRLVRVATDACEAYAVRAAAMRAIAAAMVTPLDILQQQQQQDIPASSATDEPAGLQAQLLSKQLHCFGLAPVLQLEQLWAELVPNCLLAWQQQPFSVAGAAATMAAAAMAAQPDGIGRSLLLRAGVVPAALQLCASLLTQNSSGISGQREGTLPAGQEHMAMYIQLLEFLQPGQYPPSCSSCSFTAAATNCKHGDQGPGQLQQLLADSQSLCNSAQHEAVTLALQQQCTQLAAATAAAQLLALAAAPASAGSGLLPLPAAIQQVVQQVPAVLLQLIRLVGNSLFHHSSTGVPQPADVGGDSGDTIDAVAGGSLSAGVSVLHHQLALIQVATAAVLASPVGSEPASQRKLQLLQLLSVADVQYHQQAQRCAGQGFSSKVCSSGGESGQGKLLVAVAACLSHPGSSKSLQLALVQLVGLLMSEATVAKAALGSSADDDPAAVHAVMLKQRQRPESGSGEDNCPDDSSDTGSTEQDSSFVSSAAAGEAQTTAGVAVGAALCRELASQLPFCIFTPTDTETAGSGDVMPGDSSDNGAPSVAPPEGLVLVFALQNLLTFSTAAKAAAVDIGLHKLLMETAQAMAAAVAAAMCSTGQAVAGAGSSCCVTASAGVGGTRRVRARWFSSTVAAAATGEGGHASMKKPTSSVVAFGRSGGPTPLTSTAAQDCVKRAAGPKVVGTAAGPMPRKQRQTAGQVRLRTGRASSSSGAAAGGAATADSDILSCAQTTVEQVEEPAAESLPAPVEAGGQQQADDAGGNFVHGTKAVQPTGTSRKKQQAMAAAHRVNLKKLMLTVMMMRHMAYRCHATQAALVGNGLVELLLHLWPLALQQITLLLELLQLLNNLLPTCYQARLAIASLQLPNNPSSSTILQKMLCLLIPPSGLDQGVSSSSTSAPAADVPDVVRSAAATLLHYASAEDGAVQLVKPGGSFLQDCQRVLRNCLRSCRKEHEPQPVKQSQQERLAGVLQLLAVIAGRPHGQQAMLRATVAPALVDLLVEVLLLPQQPAAVAAALLLLRNLSFNADLRSPALTNGQLLRLLLAAAECLGPAQQQLLQLSDEGSLGRPGSRDGRSASAGSWVPLYGKPLVGACLATGSGSNAGGSSAGGRPSSPALSVAGAAGAACSVPSAAGNVCCAVYAVAALWGLMYQGEKVKAAVRKLPAAAARLEAVRAHAQKLLEQHQEEVAAVQLDSSSSSDLVTHAVDQPGSNDTAPVPDKVAGAAAAAASPAAGTGGVQQWWQQQKLHERSTAGTNDGLSLSIGVKEIGSCMIKPSLSCEHDAAWWLQQLVTSCTSVLDIMENV